MLAETRDLIAYINVNPRGAVYYFAKWSIYLSALAYSCGGVGGGGRLQSGNTCSLHPNW